MAASTIILTTLQEDKDKVVILVQIGLDGDGTELASAAIFDVSAFTVGGASSEVRISEIHANLGAFSVVIENDASSNTDAIVLSGPSEIHLDSHVLNGGLVNSGGAGKTGDLAITSTNMDAGEGGSIILFLDKVV